MLLSSKLTLLFHSPFSAQILPSHDNIILSIQSSFHRNWTMSPAKRFPFSDCKYITQISLSLLACAKKARFLGITKNAPIIKPNDDNDRHRGES